MPNCYYDFDLKKKMPFFLAMIFRCDARQGRICGEVVNKPRDMRRRILCGSCKNIIKTYHRIVQMFYKMHIAVVV